MKQRRWGRPLVSAAAGLVLGGCAFFRPLPPETTLAERLEALPKRGLPLEAPVTVFWDDHHIPFIEAETDGDAAFALGLVHAHLRLGQMAVYKRVAQGRIAEMAGPLAVDVDHGIRLLGYGRAAAEIETALPAGTRRWLERFVEGVNHYQRTAAALPVEYEILGLEREPWTVRDVLTFGRLAGTDVNWLVWFSLLRLRERDDWPALWARLVRNGGDSTPSFAGGRGAADLGTILGGLSRSGSNSLALGPGRTATGSAILANDPHLGISVPNVWLIAGLKSPSYHAVGLMVPGLPFFAIGRNLQIAWGGTNMRAASSELVDLHSVAADRIARRTETIAVRWWPDSELEVRDSPWGPVVSDAPHLEGTGGPYALRWTGHRASDEVTAMLQVARAGSFDEFRAALRGFAVPGQNMLYADAAGNIGQVMAVRLPDRPEGPPADLVLPPDVVTAAWAHMVGTEDLPDSLNPAAGFLGSANNRPAEANVPIGHFFSPDDRVDRMAALLESHPAMGVDDVSRLLRDVYMESSVALRDLFVDKLRALGMAEPADPVARRAVEAMVAWDGVYDAAARGPVAFELFRAGFTTAFYEDALGASDWEAFANFARIKSLMREDIERASGAAVQAALQAGLDAAAKSFGKYASWGEIHRLSLSHPLGMIPVVGRRFRFADLPASGSSDTLMKTAHGLVEGRHTASYGSTARHISDLADPDANRFVLLGGQDGWLNSSTFLDQVPLWREGRYIQVPLRPDAVRACFGHRTVLES
jgi:penicillin amidase